MLTLQGRTCGRLQDEIDFVKKKLFDIELRIKPKIAGDDESKSETESATMATRPRGLDFVGEGDVFDLAELQSTEEVGSGARPRNLDQTRKVRKESKGSFNNALANSFSGTESSFSVNFLSMNQSCRVYQFLTILISKF